MKVAQRGAYQASGLRAAWAWFALAVVSQFAMLQLINAGPRVGYQHFATWPALLDHRYAPYLAILLVQLLAVGTGMRRHSAGVKRLLATFRWWQIAAVAALFALTSATLSRAALDYAAELALATLLQAAALGNIVLLCASLPEPALLRLRSRATAVLSQPDEPARPRIDRFALFAGLFVLIAAAVLSYFSYERHPHVPDEVIYLFHARYFAKGLLYLPAPPVPAAFDIDLLYYEADRWFSPVPPGWPAMLSLGVLFGAPWLINPILAAINVLLAYRFSWELFDRPTARIATVLLALSPWHVFMAMNFMTHTFTLLCALIAANAVAVLRRTGKLRWAWIGGLAIGMVSLNRPLEGLAVAGLLGFWTLGVRGRGFRFAPVLCLALGSIVMGALTMPYNRLLTGSATKFPIMMYTDRYYGAETNALGFGANRGLGWPGLDPFPGHGLIDVVVNANLNTFALNVELFGWATGSLLLLAVLVFSGALRRPDYYLLAAVLTIVGVHSLYWFSGGPDFGARYWYLILVPCVLLSARGAQVLAGRLQAASVARNAGVHVGVAIAALCLATLLTFYPWRAVDKYHHYRGMRPDVRELVKENDFGRSIVLVRGKRHPDYASAAPYNPLDLRADGPVFAWDRGAEVRRQLAAAYPDRTVWFLDGPSITGDGYRIVAGPLPIGALYQPTPPAPE